MNDEASSSASARPSYVLHAALFLATVITTTAAGALQVHGGASIAPIRDGLSFSVPLLAILVCHELGHYFVARLHGVPASLPYFIPLPPFVGLFGTMGAVINMTTVTTDRRKLIDIGAAGPLAGMVVAIPVLAYGLSLSRVAPIQGGALQEGNSLAYSLLKRWIHGQWLPSAAGLDVQLHPTAFAGWAGLFVTMLNLLPFGQLDGGHVATAYFGGRWERASRFLQRGLLVLASGVFVWVYWLARNGRASGEHDPGWIGFNAAFVWLLWFWLLRLLRRMSGGRDHPPVDPRPLGGARVALFWLVAMVFAAVFMPVPLRLSIAPADAPANPPASAKAAGHPP